MPDHGCRHQRDLQVEHRVAAVFVSGQVRQHHRDESFQHVDPEDRKRRPQPQHAQRVGRSGVMAAVFADIDAVKAAADPYGARNGSQQISNDD